MPDTRMMTRPCLIAFNQTAADQRGQNEADEEEGVQTHAAGLGKGHLAYRAISRVPMIATRMEAT